MGSNGQLKVGYDALDAGATDLLGAAAQLEEKIRAMEQRMVGRKPEWSGTDSDAFDTCRLDWEKGVVEMRRALESIARMVRLAKEEYVATEANNRKRFLW